MIVKMPSSNTPATIAYNKAVLEGKDIMPTDTTLSIENVDIERIKQVHKNLGEAFTKPH